MTSEDSVLSTGTFLDRWGHWILWMGPYILIVSILLWTPRLMLLMVGIELMQFILHAIRLHPLHPMVKILPVFLAVVMATLGAALIPSTVGMWLLMLVGSQVAFSHSVHGWNHRDRTGDRFQQGQYVVDIITFAIVSFLAIVLMMGAGDVPGLPLLRTFLL